MRRLQNCGLCKSSVGVTSVTEACAFLGDGMSRAESLEPAVHGRSRRYDGTDLDEAHFGVHEEILLARGLGIPGAQWTGVATGVATAWLASGAVDAVVVAGSATSDAFGAPKPVLCRTREEVLQGRRVKPSLCPSLEVLDEVCADASIRRLLFCGVGCAVQALRSLNGADPEAALGLESGTQASPYEPACVHVREHCAQPAERSPTTSRPAQAVCMSSALTASTTRQRLTPPDALWPLCPVSARRGLPMWSHMSSWRTFECTRGSNRRGRERARTAGLRISPPPAPAVAAPITAPVAMATALLPRLRLRRRL